MRSQLLYKILSIFVVCAILLAPFDGSAAQQPAQQPDPGMETSLAYNYDPSGNLQSYTSPNGITVTYEYDNLDRLLAIRYPDGTATTFLYNDRGLLARMTDRLGITSYIYDIHNRLKASTNPLGRTLQYEYDPRGYLTRLIYPDGSAATYNWDAAGRLTSFQDISGETRYTYDPNGLVNSRTLPNGVTSRYLYDQASRLIGLQHFDSIDTPLLSFRYEFDTAGRLALEDRLEQSAPPLTTRYTYDVLDQLTRVDYSDGRFIQYQYDPIGRRIGMSTPQGLTSYTYNGLGQPTQIQTPQGIETLQFDRNGNLVERRTPTQTIQYSWNADNLLSRVQDGQNTILYDYDGLGIPLRQTVNGQATEYLYNQGGILPELAGQIKNDGALVQLPIAMERLGEIQPGGLHQFYLNDGLYSVTGVLDAMGQLTGSYDYDPYGNPLNTQTSTVIGAFSYEIDDATGLFERSYLPDAGISLQRADEKVYEHGNYAISLLDAFNTVRKIYSAVDKAGSTLLKADFVEPNGQMMWGFARPSADPNLVSRSLATISYWNEFRRISTGLKFIGWASRGVQAINDFRQGKILHGIGQVATPFVSLLAMKGLGALAAAGILVTPWLVIPVSILTYLTIDYCFPDFVEYWGNVGKGKWQELRQWWVNNVDLGRMRQVVVDALAEQFMVPEIMQITLRALGLPPDDASHLLGYPPLDGLNDDLSFKPWKYPLCPPFCGDDFFGGGGGGAVAPVGGVALNQVAQVIAENLNDLSGATYDPRSGQLVLLGSKNLNLPDLDADDLAVAIRSIYSGQEPSMSIEPCNPGVEDGCMKVLYNGIFKDPNNPDGGWLTFGADGSLQVSDPPTTAGTHFGKVIFEADRYLKNATLGVDNQNPDQPFETDVPGYVSLIERWGASAQPVVEDDCQIRTPADRQRPSSCSRMWFVPNEIVVKVSEDGRTMIFDPVTIRVEARFVRFEPGGQMVDVPGNDPGVLAFVEHFNQHMAEFSAENQDLAELVQLSKLVGIIRWIEANNLPLDLNWLKSYSVQSVGTPLQTPAIKVSSGNRGLYGGVELPTTVTEVAQDAVVQPVAEAVLEARPSLAETTWRFEQAGETVEAIAVNLAPAEIEGGLTQVVNDVQVAVGEGLSAGLTRTYNSVGLGDGNLGRGWSLSLPVVEIKQVAGEQAGTYSTEAVISMDGFQTRFFLGADGYFHPEQTNSSYLALGLIDADPYQPAGLATDFALRPNLPGQAIQVEAISGQRQAIRGLSLRRRDDSALWFDELGRLRGVRNASGRELSFSYEGERLVRIHGPDGGLDLAYNALGRLAQVESSDGRTLKYAYDITGNLATVSDGSGKVQSEYQYDSQNRLVKVVEPVRQEGVEVAYDTLGRATTISYPGGNTIKMVYDDQAHTVTYTDSLGHQTVRQFDEQGRLVEEVTPAGQTLQIEYDEQGRLANLADQQAGLLGLEYDDFGNLTEITSPEGGQTSLLLYNEFGQPGAVVEVDKTMTFLEYDIQGRLTSVTDGLQVTDISADGTEVGYTQVDPAMISYAYDAQNRLTTIQDAMGGKTELAYDASGNLTSLTLPGGGKLEQFFDAAGRLIEERNLSGQSIEYHYSPEGNLVEVVSPQGQIKLRYENGQVSAIQDNLGRQVGYQRDDAGRVITRTDAGGAITRYTYDDAGRLAAMEAPNGEKILYQYDALGRLIGQKRQPGKGSSGLSIAGEPEQEIEEAEITPKPTATPIPPKPQEEKAFPWGIVLTVSGGVVGLAVIVTVVWLVARKPRKAMPRSRDESEEFYFDDFDQQ